MHYLFTKNFFSSIFQYLYQYVDIILIYLKRCSNDKSIEIYLYYQDRYYVQFVQKKFLFSNIYSIQYGIFERNFGRKERKKRKITE